MPAIVKRVEGASMFRASCPEHSRFRGLNGSMRLALKQAEDHNRMMHPATTDRDTIASALRARKES